MGNVSIQQPQQSGVKPDSVIGAIELTNFQSHQSTVIEPAPAGKLTVITGPSDSGKTAIIRALKWLLYNAPQGADFMRTGASAVRVRVKYADRQTVSRERTAATNRYRLIEHGVEPILFEGFGSAVPLEVQEITGVKTVKIADQDLTLNLSEQLDPPFLGQKSTTAPGRAKILGKLAGTEELDVAGADVGRDIYRTARDVKALEAEIDGPGGLTEQIAGFGWIEHLGERIAAAETLLAKIRAAMDRLTALDRAWTGLAAIGAAADKAQEALSRWSAVLPAAERAVLAADAAAIRCETIRKLADKINAVSYGIEAAQEVVYKLRGLEEAERAASGVSEKLGRMMALHGLRVRLSQVDADVRLCRVNLDRPRVKHAEQAAAIVETVEAVTIPRIKKLSALNMQLSENNISQIGANRELERWKGELPKLEQDYFDALRDAGICPTCGSRDFDISRMREVV